MCNVQLSFPSRTVACTFYSLQGFVWMTGVGAFTSNTSKGFIWTPGYGSLEWSGKSLTRIEPRCFWLCRKDLTYILQFKLKVLLAFLVLAPQGQSSSVVLMFWPCHPRLPQTYHLPLSSTEIIVKRFLLKFQFQSLKPGVVQPRRGLPSNTDWEPKYQ